MNETADFTIGAEVTCKDGPCGALRRLVVDPIVRSVTHLVVEPRHQRYVGHLVPIDLVDTTTKELRLRCTMAEFEALEDAEETEYLPGMSLGLWGYLGIGPQVVTYDKVPMGEVEVQRGQHVLATDGPIGHVRGLLVDPSDDQVTHVLLDEGHLWSEKEVAIPISAVTGIDDGVRLSLTKEEVRGLPPVQIAHYPPAEAGPGVP